MLLRTQRVGGDDVGYVHLVVKPSNSSAGAVPPRPAEIISRAEIARRRNAQTLKPPVAAVAWSEPPAEMHVADVTPIPKNKGGRPRKNP